MAHPSLVDLISGPQADRLGIATKGKAVIPGCGRGYDVDLLSKRGLDALGVDISPTGVKAAQEWLDKQPSDSSYGKKEVLEADYFEWVKTVSHQWNVLLDYTFLCALPPSLRSSWSEALSILANPDSSTRLITLMYPLPDSSFTLPKEGDRQGPPFMLSVEEYHRLLDDKWELIHCEDVPDHQRRNTGAPGGEKVGVWAWRA